MRLEPVDVLIALALMCVPTGYVIFAAVNAA